MIFHIENFRWGVHLKLQYVNFSPLEVAYSKQRSSLMMQSLSVESWEESHVRGGSASIALCLDMIG